jgi:hypothetical protein
MYNTRFLPTILKLFCFLIGIYIPILTNYIYSVLVIIYGLQQYFKLYGVINNYRQLPLICVITENIILGIIIKNLFGNVFTSYIIISVLLLLESGYILTLNDNNNGNINLLSILWYSYIVLITIISIIISTMIIHNISIILVIYLSILILNIIIRIKDKYKCAYEWNYDTSQLLYIMIADTKDFLYNLYIY